MSDNEVSDSSFSSLTAEQRRLNDTSDWEYWAGTIELKLSRQGQYIVGLGAGLLATLLLVGFQGKIVINLAKTQPQIVNAINALVEAGGLEPSAEKTRYSKPSGSINESEVSAVNPEELNELQELMRKSKDGELPTFKE